MTQKPALIQNEALFYYHMFILYKSSFRKRTEKYAVDVCNVQIMIQIIVSVLLSAHR